MAREDRSVLLDCEMFGLAGPVGGEEFVVEGQGVVELVCFDVFIRGVGLGYVAWPYYWCWDV